jgi:2-dehydro-3-deoxyphosphogluconate aldolase/(4S)-4-hydroxy-2-oxoglutarate aldolase
MKPSETAFLQETLQKLRLVPVISLPSVKAGLMLSEILLRCNLPVAEITFRTACGPESISAIKKEYPELLLLAGTVLTPPQVDLAVESGAAAIVSPGFTPQMAAYCRQKAVPFYPGICTPSEVQMAMDAGLTSLKFFPAENAGGIQMISLFKAIYPDMTFMPTGGIKLENIASYLHLDNVVCCGGTWLAPEQLMVEERWEEIEKRVISAVQIIAQ